MLSIRSILLIDNHPLAVPPTRSRPTSQTSTGAVPSPAPRKSVTESEIQPSPPQPQSPPPMPKRSMPLPPPSSLPVPQPSSSNGSGEEQSPLEAEMQRLLEPIRKEIADLAAMLNVEKQKRERLEQELEALKQQQM